jgi:hypothetical protein
MTTLRTPLKPAGTARQGLGATARPDNWAIEPGIVALGFTAFIVYSLFSALLWGPVFGVNYEADGYLSPFFSPLIGADWLPCAPRCQRPRWTSASARAMSRRASRSAMSRRRSWSCFPRARPSSILARPFPVM